MVLRTPFDGRRRRRRPGGGLKREAADRTWKVGGHLKASPGGAIVRPGQLFAICGVLVLVGVVYLRNAPSPESDATLETISATKPATSPPTGDGSTEAHAVVRSVTADLTISLKALAEEAMAEIPQAPVVTAPPTTVRELDTTVAPVIEPPTVAPIVVSTTTTVAPLLSLVPVPPVAIAPVPAVAAVVEALANSESGIASWYGAPKGTCAHKTLPFGTMVRVTRVSTGAVVTCKVADRGPFTPGRVIDLSDDMFEGIATLGTGLTAVKIEW